MRVANKVCILVSKNELILVHWCHKHAIITQDGNSRGDYLWNTYYICTTTIIFYKYKTVIKQKWIYIHKKTGTKRERDTEGDEQKSRERKTKIDTREKEK